MRACVHNALGNLGSLLGNVYTRLASAVPDLKELSLSGFCWDCGVSGFRIFCPTLVTLQVEALLVPLESLHNLHEHLPNLSTVTLASEDADSDDAEQLGAYIDAFLGFMQHCTALTSLGVDVDVDVSCDSEPAPWNSLPASLQHLRCGCRVNPQVEKVLFHRVSKLCVRTTPYEYLSDLVNQYPLLEGFEQL